MHVAIDSATDAEILNAVYTILRKNKEEDYAGKDTVSAERKKSVEQHHKWKDKNYKQPGSRDERSRFVSNHTHQSTTDKDARVSVKPGKPRQLNYLAQVSVDTAHHVITQIQSDYASKKDSQCLPWLGQLQKRGY